MLSIRSRFLIVSIISLTLALSFAGWVFIRLFTTNLEAQTDAELTGHLNRLAGTLSFADDGTLKRPDSPADNRFLTAYGGLYWQIDDPDRAVRLRSPSLFDYALPLPDDGHERGTIHRYRLPGPDTSQVQVQERQIKFATPTGPRELRVAVAIDAAQLDSAAKRFAFVILPYMIALALFLVAMSVSQLSFGLRQLSALARDMVAVRERRKDRLTGAYPGELKDLVDQLNAYMDSQAKTVAKARARAADLAHGLKTPLTVLANDALTLRDKGETDLADEIETMVDTMQSHVEHELARSRIAQTPDQRGSDADLAKIVHELVRTLKRTPDGETLIWHVNVPADDLLPIDPHDLRELIGNILENASKWAKSSITITSSRQGTHRLVSVEDDGPGVAPDKIGTLTTRGKRLDHQKPGTGLGLSIVNDICDVYGITLTIGNRAEGGLKVGLRW
jgi:signal transduction histidine kinase